METNPQTIIKARRFVQLPERIFVGSAERHDCEVPNRIPDQWQRFSPHLGQIPRQVGADAYGLVYNMDEEGSFDYMAGVLVDDPDDIPEGLALLRVPAARYAVFYHADHVASIRDTMAVIWTEWFPQSDRQPAAGATLEVYGESFDPHTGQGGVEIQIPIRD